MIKAFIIVGIISIILIIGVYFIFFREGQKNILTLTLTNLEPLDSGHLEVWAIFDEEKVSLGKFDVGDPLIFTSEKDLGKADKITITIEPDGDTDTVPSGVILLTGDISKNKAKLTFPINLNDAKGNYILFTPTTFDDTDEKSGIWFAKLPEPLTAGLTLPTLTPNSGWKYEGWVVHKNIPLSTGKFLSPSGADDFNGYGHNQPAPPFPGEDFIFNLPSGLRFPLDLGNGASKAIISIEPDVNGVDPTGGGPYQIKPLVADIPAGAKDRVNYGMKLNLDSLPLGEAKLS